ncbi:MAG TPA: NADH-quinone oxidoreductase subunit NuoI [Candidatus Solibacter sp.]|jgi:NADH-quinone oxidoreductase subunit I|nr:NADH-quinone oxidoreductase subunit NuoI [Candidatus Solibacter sp.]
MILENVLGVPGALGTTFKHLFRPPTTVEYPEELPAISARHRGRHILHRYEDGLEKCVGCELCAAACPAKCILVVAEENTDTNRVSPGERYASRYEINLSRCIFCGYCEEACPVGAITMGPRYDISEYDVRKLIITKDDLLEARWGAGAAGAQAATAPTQTPPAAEAGQPG